MTRFVMCLIAFAHDPAAPLPLILAANRDEDHERPTLAAHFWRDAPQVLGGRDERAGGGWLAVTRGGRWAAVTNVRGAAPPGGAKSRGALVREFVTSSVSPRRYVEAVDITQYAGFHLFAGEIGGEVAWESSVSTRLLDPGVHGVSNAPAGEEWPKVAAAVARVGEASRLRTIDAIIDDLMPFLATRGESIESSPFVAGDRYGTRASTVIVAARDAIHFVEQSWQRGGAKSAPPLRFSIPR